MANGHLATNPRMRSEVTKGMEGDRGRDEERKRKRKSRYLYLSRRMICELLRLPGPLQSASFQSFVTNTSAMATGHSEHMWQG